MQTHYNQRSACERAVDPCRYDFFARQEAILGQHMAGARCVEWLPDRGLLATGSWDCTLCCWDPRIPQVSKLFDTAQSCDLLHAADILHQL